MPWDFKVMEPNIYGLLIFLVKYELNKLYFDKQTGSSLFKERLASREVREGGGLE